MLSEILTRSEIGEAILEICPIIISEIDTGEIIFASTPAELMLGYLVNELKGKNVDELVPDAARKKHAEYRKTFSANPSARAMGPNRKLTARLRNGQEIPVSVGLWPRVIAGKRCCAAIIVDLRGVD